MKRTTIILLAVLGLFLASCGSGAGDTDAGGSTDADTENATEGNTDEAGADGDADESGDGDVGATEGDADDSTDDAMADGDAAQEGNAGQSSETAGQSLGNSEVAAALAMTEELASARFEGKVDIAPTATSEIPVPVAITFSGAFDQNANATEITMDLSDVMTAAMEADPEAAAQAELFGSFFEDPIQMISIGETSWIKWGFLALLGVEDKWIEGPAESGSEMTSGFGFGGGSPNELLGSLSDADATVEVIGEEDIRGVKTTHHRAVVDAATLAEKLSAEDLADLETEVGLTTEGNYVIDMWVDDSDLLHRFVLEATELTSDEEVDSMTMTYDIFDHGSDVGITPPPADQVVSEDELGLDLGDLGGVTGG